MAVFTSPYVAQAAGVNVSIEGVEPELKSKLLTVLTIARQKNGEELSEARIRRLHRKAQDEIKQVMQAFGYYRLFLGAKLHRAEQTWEVHYRLIPGEPLKVKKLDIQITGAGKDDPQLMEYSRSPPLKEDDVLVHDQYEKTKRGLLERALDLGYLDARFTQHQIRIDLNLYQAQVVLGIDTGPIYRFGPINLIQESLQPALLARYVVVKPGDPFTTSRLLALENSLRDSDYFSRIRVQPRREHTQNHAIPVDVLLQPRKKNKYTFGLGYGTDTGARGSVGWERRLLNRRGHRMGVDLKLSERRNSLTGRYYIPIRDPRTDRLFATVSRVHERQDTSESRINILGVGQSIARNRWQETLSLNFQRESFIIADQVATIQVLFPSIHWEWLKADDRVFAHRGSRFNLMLRGAHESIVSNVSFAQTHLKAKSIQPLWSGARLIARAEIGATEVTDIRDLPASLRFFAGGDYSVRGYSYNSLGPVDRTGRVIGGSRLLVGSLEYEHRLGGNWSAAVFYDAGNALERFSDTLKKGAGIGLRWKSPIGQIRIDVASALSEPNNPLRWHIIIGPDL